MSAPSIVSIATDVPQHRFTQEEIADYFLMMQPEPMKRERGVRSIFEKSGVGQRYMAIDRDFFLTEQTTKSRNDYYMQKAPELGHRAIERALQQSELTAEDIDDFVVVSCTGYNVPGLDLILAHRLGMRHDLRRSTLLGMGCYGSFPGLLRSVQSAQTDPDRVVLMLSIELCSVHLQLEPTSENVVSTSLFADGAGAVIVGGQDHPTKGPRIIDSSTRCDYQTLDHMSFEVTDHGFQMHLSSYVPDVLAANVEDFIDGLLHRNGVKRNQVAHWGVHPGSYKILRYIQDQLSITDQQMTQSYDVLQNYGNMSSATILFIMEQIQRCDNPQAGDYGVMMAFGPGLTMESILVQW